MRVFVRVAVKLNVVNLYFIYYIGFARCCITCLIMCLIYKYTWFTDQNMKR